ncbi:MAG TPA: biotin--[acetyl-CoA-carboxylase] ligase [Gemmatimonadales bacterium]|nr:biotin--[acetyl-CoA-carboxylase] ligase [Gemmatimonadales bacterium]
MSLAATVRVRWCESVGSTQDELHAMAEAGAPAGTVVAARYQTAGRGSRGRPWTSDEGGLWMSTLLRPPADAQLEPLVPRVALQVADVLEAVGTPEVGLKWPNDILARGAKLAGILSEARWNATGVAWVAVGLGLNVRNELPIAAAWPATRLADLGVERSSDSLADDIAAAILRAGASTGFLSDAELAEWDRRDVLRGRMISSPMSGRARGISRAGALLIEGDDGRSVPVSSGIIALATA